MSTGLSLTQQAATEMVTINAGEADTALLMVCGTLIDQLDQLVPFLSRASLKLITDDVKLLAEALTTLSEAPLQ
jgi:hypothetical protein